VDRDHPRRLLGVVHRHDVIRAYNLAILRRLDAQQRAERLRLGKLGGTQFVEIEIGLKSPVMGRKLEEMRLPESCIVVSVQRGRRVIIPHGDTVLSAGDRIVAFTTEECASALRDVFRPIVRTDENAGPPTLN
jgi:CIC family chloride channel protein